LIETVSEQVKLLPRKKQQLVIEFLDAIISTEKAWATTIELLR
jgi:hypothetical protein